MLELAGSWKTWTFLQVDIPSKKIYDNGSLYLMVKCALTL